MSTSIWAGRKLRRCLACQKNFQSWCSANRVCAACKAAQEDQYPDSYTNRTPDQEEYI